MSVPQDDQQAESAPSTSNLNLWQIRGGIAGVLSLGVAVVTFLLQIFPVAIAIGLLTFAGGATLLYRWGNIPERRTLRGFLLSLSIALVGALIAGLAGGVIVYSKLDSIFDITGSHSDGDGSMASTTPTSTSASSPTTSAPSPPVGNATTSTTVPIVSYPSSSTVGDPQVWRKDESPMTINFLGSVDFDSLEDNRGTSANQRDGFDLLLDQTVYFPGSAAIVQGIPGYEDCRTSTGLKESFSGRIFEKGMALCIKTTDGRWARAVVVSSAFASMLVLDSIIVWDKK